MKKKLLFLLLSSSLILFGCEKKSESETSVSSSTPVSVCDHELSSSYLFNETEHWKECTKCHEKFEVENHIAKERVVVEATCTTGGKIEHYCEKCAYSYEELTDALGHSFGDPIIVEPTVETEGSYTITCSRCSETIQKKILRLPAFVSLVGNIISWADVTNAEGYIINLNNQEIDVGGLTTYQVTTLDDLSGDFKVYAYTSSDEYFTYNGKSTTEAFRRAKDNIQSAYNSNFENDSRIRLNRIGGWNNYPYGNWSDMNDGLGGHYYIHQESDGNMAALIPAVVWWPGNTTLKRDLGSGCWAVGTYEISFDIKASESSLTYTANGNYGKITGYLWNTHNASDPITIAGTGVSFNEVGLVIKDIPNISTSAYTNVRLRYTLNSNVPYNQFNLIYWPEQNIGEDNYIIIDNIEVFKVIDGVVQTDNVDNNIGGDFECWNIYTMENNLWYANNTILPENNALASAIIKEDQNQALKIASVTDTKAQINLAGNPAKLGQGGVFEMDIKVKKSAELINPEFSFKMWGFKAGSPIALTEEVFIDVTSASADTYTQYTVRFLTNEVAALDSINIFFTTTFTNPVGSNSNYLIIDDVEIYALVLGGDSTMNMLMIGNSATDDTVEYIYNILENLGEDVSKINIYVLFFGGCTINQHYDFYNNDYANYDLRAYNKTSKAWYNLIPLCSLRTALKLHSHWDFISFQQAGAVYKDNTSFNNLSVFAESVRDIVGPNTSFVFNAGPLYLDAAAQASGFSGREEMYEHVTTIDQKVMEGFYSVQFDKYIPKTTAIKNAEQPFNVDLLHRDDIHLSFGLGRYMASLTMVAAIFDKDINDITYVPDGVGQSDLNNIIRCVNAALVKPYEVTTL
ncbi:MAG: DUF4886 domain-containing protein [Bacilli bacterium]|jgi:hypothetical protein